MRNFVNIYNQLERMEQLIHLECTGTAKELAKTLGISQRAVFYHFSILKKLGNDIEFSYINNTYYQSLPQHRLRAAG